MSVEIRQIDPFAHRDAIFRIYCDSLGVDRISDAAREWRDTILPRHATRADFDFRAAVDTDDGIVGFVYGYTGAYGQWWTDRVAADMSEEARRVWLDPPAPRPADRAAHRARCPAARQSPGTSAQRPGAPVNGSDER